jgi:hypothetical protein
VAGYAVVRADEVEDSYAGSDVPGEFRRLTEPLGAEQLAATLIRVAPGTTRSHRNEGDEPVEIWAVSRLIDREDSTKVDDFWAETPGLRH